MIKLKQLITERKFEVSGRKYEISDKIYNHLITNNFSTGYEYNSRGHYFYRGAKNYGEYYLVNPKKVERKSKDASNLYYVLMDNLPSWKGYPKRSKSIIFSGDKNIADQYESYIYNVIPINTAKIVVGKYSPDQFVVFPYVNERYRFRESNGVSSFSDKFSDFYEFTIKDINNQAEGTSFIDKEDIKKLSLDEYGYFLKIMNEQIIPFVINNKGSEIWKKRIEYNIMLDILVDIQHNAKPGQAEQYFDDLLNPEKNDIELLSVEESMSKYGNGYLKTEMWTDSVCLLNKL